MLHSLQKLTFLDFQPVTKAEVAEAKRRGKFSSVAKPQAAAGGAAAAGSTAEVRRPLPLPGIYDCRAC